MRKVTKKTKIIRYLALHPDAKPGAVAKATGSTLNSVYTIKNRYKGEIAAKRRELQDDNLDTTLDLSEYMEAPKTEVQTVDAIVDERAEKYGKFESLAEVSQRFKDSLHYFLITRNKYLAPDQQEAMELIFHKFARVINGDADYVDNWKDIAGYATLIADRLEGNAR